MVETPICQVKDTSKGVKRYQEKPAYDKIPHLVPS